MTLRRSLPLKTKLIALALAALCVWPGPATAARRAARKYSGVTAKSAIFSNSTKVKRYYGKNVHKKVLPASTTKVMTALVVMDHLALNRVVVASAKASKAQPSKIHVQPGERFLARDLLYATLISSANDASIVLAEAVAGSEWEFTKMMNRKARQLGCRHTHFANASGLPSQERQFTTAYDMYLIFREALNYDFFRQAIEKKYHTITSLTGRKVSLKSHNKILFFDWKQKLFGKTGYTRAAQACFVGYLKKGKDICIIAVFGCSERWADIKHIVSRYGGVGL